MRSVDGMKAWRTLSTVEKISNFEDMQLGLFFIGLSRTYHDTAIVAA